jgi:hypothetical protein
MIHLGTQYIAHSRKVRKGEGMTGNFMTARRTLLLMVVLAWISGCATPPKGRMTVAPEPVEHSALLINDTLIDQKIGFLEGILGERELSREDRETATAVLAAYKQLKEAASSRLGEKDYQRLILSLFNAVSLMDDAYYGRKKIGQRVGDSLACFSGKRRAIIDQYLKGNYKGVIQEARELESVVGTDAITPEIGILFALSLAREGDLKQATRIGEGITDDLDRLPDGVELRARTAQWQLALGRRERALQIYEGLTNKEDQRAALLEELGQQLRAAQKEKETGETAVAKPGAGPVADDLWQEEGHTIEQLLQKVRSLVQEHAYGKARILILRERIRIGEGPENELLDRELEKIDQQEGEFQEQKQAREADAKETQETARRLIDEEKYEAALNALGEMEASQELDSESRALKERAAEGHINKERNRAAEIFLTARKTSDPSKKKELLNSAYNILKTLIDTYPSSPLNQKLRSHIAVVQNELNRLK